MSYYVYVALTATILVPLAIGTVFYKSLPGPVKIFYFLIVAGTFNELIMFITGQLKMQNLYTLHFYTLAELLLLSWFFYLNFFTDVWRKYVIGGVVALVAFSILYASWGNNLFGFNSLPRALESVFIISLTSWLFYERFILNITEIPLRSGVFFLTGGILFYFASSFIIFAFANYITSINGFLITMYTVHAFINAFCNLVFAFGLWMSSRSYSIAQ